MACDSALVIGLDIGGSKTLAGLTTRAGAIVATAQSATPSSPGAVLEQAEALCRRLLADAEAPVIGIGIGSAGVIDTGSGKVLFANDNLPGWSGADLSALDLGGRPMFAENDARAFAIGEAILGAGVEHDSLLCVTVGTGIGGAVIVDGEVWHGANFCAGEIGYLVVDWEAGAPVILDQFASGPAIERAYQAAVAGAGRIPLPQISRRAQTGDAEAIAAIEGKARQLGAVLAGCATALNPAAVVVGGGVPQAGALWREALESGFRDNLPPPVAETPLLPAALGAKSVMLGAAMLAWRRLDG